MEEDFSQQDYTIPQVLQRGTPVMKVSSKKHKSIILRLDPDLGQVIWESKQNHIIPIENIKELRSGLDTRYYREQFQLAQDYEDRWLTIVYILNGAYKTLHVISPTKDMFNMWNTALRELYVIRQALMTGLGHPETRLAIWEKQCWKRADEHQGQKLKFQDVEKLCKRLNIHSNSEDLSRLFKEADKHQRGYLDFDDFRHFVKLLKARPEIDKLFEKLRTRGGGVFDLPVFEKFMREKQKSHLKQDELQSVFERYSEFSEGPPVRQRIMTLETFMSFLLSTDNSPFLDQHGKVWHDMTRPLPDYYVSSSHNTYLVGHQLVGVSTIEGYIRALLHGCRSVELDIYDNDPITQPMIFHGKTFTSKVPLRDVCHAIVKYGFVASPYPIVISAEMHCSVVGQEIVVVILKEVFGPLLVNAPINGERGKLERLPSPQELKGRILFKTKNLDLERRDSMGEGEDTPPSTETSSTSDSDAAFEQYCQGHGIKTVMEPGTGKDFKGDLFKAGSSVLQHVRSVGKMAPSPSYPGNGGKPQQYLLPKLRTASLPEPIRSPDSSPKRNDNPDPGHPEPIYVDQALSISPISSPSSPMPLPSRSPAEPQSWPVPRSVSDPEVIKRLPLPPSPSTKSKPKMSPSLVELLVYTTGVKYKGINKKEVYKPEHMFSLSETTANRVIRSVSPIPALVSSFSNARHSMSPPRGGNRQVNSTEESGMQDLIKHCRTHLARVYPKATRVNSTNFEPHRYWSAGVQLVAINWQTFDLGYMINHAMFQRNGRSGYVLKPAALRGPNPASPNEMYMTKDLLAKRTTHYLDVSIISAQQLPRPKDSSGQEISDKSLVLDPFVEVSIHVPDWTTTASSGSPRSARTVSPGTAMAAATPARVSCQRTGVVKNNGFNPIWDEKLRIPFDCVGDMRDLVFVRFVVRQAGRREDEEPLAVYCASLGSLGLGYRHLPLHNMQLSQYLFSTLFVRMAITNA